jgi:transcriptional regulator with XRE-family HTH domain
VEDNLRRLGGRIRELRIERGFPSQEAFADYLKMHRTFIGHLETGRKDFRMTTMIRVAEALGVTLSDLFAGIEAGEPFKPKRGAEAAVERSVILRELEAVEKSVKKLKTLAGGGSGSQKSPKK